MAHYAFLDENNIVIQVIPGVNENELIEGITPEQWYENFVGKKCVRTSYNTLGGIHLNGGTPFRKNYGGVGYYYDSIKDAFIPPRPEGDGHVLNEETCLWDSENPYPMDGKKYTWNNATNMWEETITPS